MDEDKARTVARLQVLTDAMGRRTHGLAMAALYLADINKGGMQLTGEPTIIKDNGISAVWDGHYLPGLWLANQTIEVAIPRAQTHGLAAIAIRRSHHIGCLAALAKQAADQGLVALIANSDPAGQRVAPYGGTEALLTPNPIAMGYPTSEQPVRMPGDQAARSIAAAQAQGISYDRQAWSTITPWATRLGVALPVIAEV